MSNLSRRGFLTAGITLATAATLSACGEEKPTKSADGKELMPVKVGYIADGNGCMLQVVADHLDLWTKHGLKPSYSAFTAGPPEIQAIGTGDIDFGYIGFGASWLPMTGKAKIVSINSFGQADRVIARPGVSSMKDLKGKKVGVPEGTSGDMLLNIALKDSGMGPTDIERVVMDPPTCISAFASGQVDAVALWYPFVDSLKKQVPDLVEVVKSADFPDLAFPASLVAGWDVAEKKAELLKRFQAVAKESFEWAADHKDEYPALAAKFLKDAPEDSIKSELEFVEILKPSKVSEMFKDEKMFDIYKTLNKLFVEYKGDKIKDMADPKEYILYKEYDAA